MLLTGLATEVDREPQPQQGPSRRREQTENAPLEPPAEAPPEPSKKGRRKQGKGGLVAPDVAVVEQAFKMLDPTGAGLVNRYALQGVSPPFYTPSWPPDWRCRALMR